MELAFKSFETPIPDKERVQMGHEPDNELVAYYMKANKLANMSTYPDFGSYDNLTFAPGVRRMTAASVVDYGVKTFPQIGAYGFYTLLYEDKSIVLCPIKTTQHQYEAPQVEIVDSGTTIDLTITATDPYDCYRVIVRKDFLATEFITYDTSFSFVPMYDGECTITVIGHKDEISITSQPFEHIMTLVNREEIA